MITYDNKGRLNTSTDIPPTEKELAISIEIAQCQQNWNETTHYLLRHDIDCEACRSKREARNEIRRLRAMCRAAIPFIERHPTGLPGEYRAGQMIDELDKASKGEA
jgi:hypothetical protein